MNNQSGLPIPDSLRSLGGPTWANPPWSIRSSGQLVAPVSPRPQTTRRKQLGILTLPNAQLVFMDTPGLHREVDRLGAYMNSVAETALLDADLILWLVAADEPPHGRG